MYLYNAFPLQLVCSICGHTSVKYDPFGTLSVPLPYANQIQISECIHCSSFFLQILSDHGRYYCCFRNDILRFIGFVVCYCVHS